MSDTPFGEIPTSADFLAQQSSAYQADEQARAASAAQSAEAPAEPAATPEPTVDPYARYRAQPKATYDLYSNERDATQASLDDLLARRGQHDPVGKPFDDYRIAVRDPEGKRAGIALGQLDDALGQGFTLESSQESRVGRFLDENKGLKGDAWAAATTAVDQLSFGAAGALWDRVLSPEDRAKMEALKNEHEFAANAGAATGFAGSFLLGAPLFKGAALAGRAAEAGLARVLASRAAIAGGEEGAKALGASLATKILGGAVKLGVESAVVAAPQAVTEAALGDPNDAAETLTYALGAGAVLGSFGAIGKSLVGRVFKGTGARVADAAERAGAAEAEAVGTVEGERADWDRRFAETERARGMHAEPTGVPTSAVDAASQAFIDAQKAATPEEREAMSRVAKGGLGKKTAQEDLLNANARELARLGDEVLRVDDGVLGKTAFGESRERMLADKVDPTKWETASKLVNGVYERSNAVVKQLESLPAGEQTGPVRRMRSALGSFEHRELWSRQSGQDAQGVMRDSYLYLQKLKQDIGKASGFGKLPHERTHAERVAYDLYHEILPSLTDESAWGAAATATKDVNLATTGKLERVTKLNAAFIDRNTKESGNAVREFDPADMKSYLSTVNGPESDKKEQALRGWFDGMRNLMSAVEKHHDLSPPQVAEFTKAKGAITAFETGIAEAKKNADALRVIRGMQENEAGHGANFMGLGLVFDAFSKPMTTVERMHHIREYAERAEKAGILVTEQAQRHAGEKLDEIPTVLGSMRSRAAGAARNADASRVTTRAIAAIIGDHVGATTRERQFKALRDRVTATAANQEALTSSIATRASSLTAGAAPTVATAYIEKQQHLVAYLAREMPRVAPREAFGAKRDDAPPAREILEYERKVEAAYDPIGTVTRHLAAGTLTKTHVKALEELYPGTLAKIRDRVTRAAGEPNAPVLDAVARARLAVLMGSAGAKPADFARYQAPYQQPVKGRPSGAGLDKMPELGTDIARISGG